MEKSKKLKIYIGIIYLIIVFAFIYLLLSNFTLEEITSYKFIQLNREYLVNLKQKNFLAVSLVTIIVSILWVLLLGFGSIVGLVIGDTVYVGALRRLGFTRAFTVSLGVYYYFKKD